MMLRVGTRVHACDVSRRLSTELAERDNACSFLLLYIAIYLVTHVDEGEGVKLTKAMKLI